MTPPPTPTLTLPASSALAPPRSALDVQRDAFLADVRAGLARSRKRLPCKYFYDPRGSALFDRICELPEYYLTRTETAILRTRATEIAQVIGRGATLIEYGSGSSTKTRILLDHLQDPAAYVPIDISRQHLLHAARRLAADYPSLRILPVCGDYTRELALPAAAERARRRIVFFPGSTIGNFPPHDAQAFLAGMRDVCGSDGGILIGVDLKKDPAILHAAYNDSAGVTAQFNLNLLGRINRELGGDFDLDQFAHYAYYNPFAGRIEMHLVSRRRQAVRLAGDAFGFGAFETIFTERSHKYTPDEFAALAAGAGLCVERCWLDDRRWFAVMSLRIA